LAAGDTVAGKNATAGSGTYTIQPSAGVEVVVHNIYVSGACNLIVTDGTINITLRALVSGEWLSNLAIHITNTEYLKITDTSTSTNNMGYDGIETK